MHPTTQAPERCPRMVTLTPRGLARGPDDDGSAMTARGLSLRRQLRAQLAHGHGLPLAACPLLDHAVPALDCCRRPAAPPKAAICAFFCSRRPVPPVSCYSAPLLTALDALDLDPSIWLSLRQDARLFGSRASGRTPSPTRPPPCMPSDRRSPVSLSIGPLLYCTK